KRLIEHGFLDLLANDLRYFSLQKLSEQRFLLLCLVLPPVRKCFIALVGSCSADSLLSGPNLTVSRPAKL
ncbi:hypothetical protein, partial [Caballeronia sp. BR00000012568055]|uniref:hypothetical protein n=1 Tax=Caballeronia sp. BR00000012568055 TaxID=2918761 RepID=UPI0023F9AF9A